MKKVLSFPAIAFEIMPKATDLCIMRTHVLMGGESYRMTRKDAAAYIKALRSNLKKLHAEREAAVFGG